MAKRVVWSLNAKNERRQILEYWHLRNGNKNYSRKLSREFNDAVKYISQYNYMGRKIDMKM
ncbi:hypothetical protein JZK55_01200 [Dissulfurispira thermophila]|uniref:Uncharacterized protein n=1 Tax=Dissulfurispira thermophila TaxID=2715679 RepID=A0A7G1GYD6_9BACT|nr:hypothetical protein [Dissulfurispira thermophila]BCB95198.1 hypothetical protein JZK55_01200 [Dissulfurispira thermophila]